MEITPSPKTTPQQTILLNEAQLKLEGLKVGQQLLARVLAVQKNGEVSLQLSSRLNSQLNSQLGNIILSAKTNLPLTEGQTLSLLIAQLGKQIILKPSEQRTQKIILNQAMREALPQQKPLKEVFSVLKQHALQAPNTNRSIPIAVTQMIQQMMQNLPSLKDISQAAGLKKAMFSSGPLLEKNISTSAKTSISASINSDLKAMLYKLKSVLLNQTKVEQAQKPQPTQSSDSESTSAKETLINSPKSKSLVNNQATANNFQSRTITSTLQSTNKPTNTQSANIQQTIQAEKTEQVKTLTTQAEKQVTPAQTEKSTQLIQRAITQTASPLLKQAGEAVTKIDQKTSLANSLQLPRKESQEDFIKMVRLLQMSHPEPSKNANIQTSQSATADLITNLLKTVESALARTQLHQLNTLADLETGKLAWTLELPIRHKEDIDIIKMRIQRDANNSDEEQSLPISITIAVDLPNTGPIIAKITLLNSDVTIGFWAEHNHIFSLIENNVEELQTRLQESGLSACEINCHQGIISDDLDPEPPATDGLLDIQA